MTHHNRVAARQGAFTLIEVLIVVIILGILAAIVIPGIAASQQEGDQMAFIEDLRIFTQAAQLYRFECNEHLPAAAPGVVPAGWESYIDTRAWQRLTPIDGAWDVENGGLGVTSALGVDFVNGGGDDRDDAYMEHVDNLMDDRGLTTGALRRLADGMYYNVLAD